MKKIIKLTENDLLHIIKRIIKEQPIASSRLSEDELDKMFKLNKDKLFDYFKARMIALNEGNRLAHYEMNYLNILDNKSKKDILNILDVEGFFNFFNSSVNNEDYLLFFDKNKTNEFEYPILYALHFLGQSKKPELFIPYFNNILNKFPDNLHRKTIWEYIYLIMKNSTRPEDFLPYFGDYFGALDDNEQFRIIKKSKNKEMFIPYLEYLHAIPKTLTYMLNVTKNPQLFIPILYKLEDQIKRLPEKIIKDIVNNKNGDVFYPIFKEMGLI